MARALRLCKTLSVHTVFHVDMDAFFVSVEELYDPSLKGKPVVVGGRPNERGVVAAASYAAREFGIHSAMPLRTAYKLCPQATFVEGHPSRYREYSERVHEVLQTFSPKVEMASIDEAYLDMTGTAGLWGPPLRAADLLHKSMKEAIGLNCSVGIASARMVAKVASDMAKPNGLLWVMPGLEASYLAPLPVRRIPGIGKVMEKSLHAMGIERVGDLAKLESDELELRFGKWGLALAGKAQGRDAGGWYDQEIGADTGAKSISHEHTFAEDTANPQTLESTLARLTQMVARRLRESGLFARTVQLKLRYSDFSTITRAHSFGEPTQLDHQMLSSVQELFRRNWDRKRAVRLLGVQASALEETAPQATLLDASDNQRWAQALIAADKLRDKYGDSVVSLASAVKAKLRERVHDNPANLPGKTKK
jgi:DNA polymerase IV